MARDAAPLEVPAREWDEVAAYVNAEWKPDSSPHHAIIAQTRAGKSSLIRHGLLPLVPYDRVLVLDSKGGRDRSWSGWGRTVSRFPSSFKLRSVDPETPRAGWFRLVIPRTRAEGRPVVAEALDKVIQQGDWIVVVDETRHVTDAGDPGLGLRGPYEELVLRGGAHGVMVISGTQAPRWVPSSFYDGAAFAWFGRLRDQVIHKRILEVGGMSRELLPTVSTLPRFSWLLNADGGDYLAVVKAPSPPAIGGQ